MNSDNAFENDEDDESKYRIGRGPETMTQLIQQSRPALYDNMTMAPPPLAVRGHISNNAVRGQLYDSELMMEKNRASLRRFEALTVDGETITSLSIGGYAVDLSKAAQKASEITPLPPARLPIIFTDAEMNFHHHFFQGLEILFGRGNLNTFVSKKKYYDDSYTRIITHIEHLIKIGYRPNDTDITLFTKRVLMSTFSIPQQFTTDEDARFLIVDANLWGFQYIESGMQMKDSDLQMWLSICYGHFRTIWFNTFKASGVPAFALEGVQTRYSERKPSADVKSKDNATAKTRRTVLDPSPDQLDGSMRSRSKKKSQSLLGWH
jgi:hypothetical protein